MQKRKLDEFIMEDGQFTIEFFEKINMKDVLGDMLFVDKPGNNNNKMSYKQFEKALENVEDADDVVATKNANKEQEDIILEDVKFEATPSKGMEENENPQIDRNMLPPLYTYGMNFVDYLVGDQGIDFEGDMEKATHDIQEEKKEEEEEDDYVLPPNFNRDSDDDDENINKSMPSKQAKKAYQDTKKLIVRNYFL